MSTSRDLGWKAAVKAGEIAQLFYPAQHTFFPPSAIVHLPVEEKERTGNDNSNKNKNN